MFQGYELNLRDYWNIFLKRKWVIILSFGAVCAATIAYTNLQPNLYKASAVIKIEPTIGISEVFPERAYYRTSSELSDYTKQITSIPIVERALTELVGSGTTLKLRTSTIAKKSDPGFNTAVSLAASALSAETIVNTNMIRITMVSDDPKEAAIIVNKVIEVFKIDNIKQKNKQLRNVREFIEQQLERVSAELEQSEDRLKVLTLKGVGGLASSITVKISELESRRADLLTKFTELHPDAIKLDEQIFELKQQLKNLPKDEFEFSTLKRDIALNEQLYNSLRVKLQEAQIKESERIDNVVMISPAMTPFFPFSPNKPGNYLIGIVLGIILAVSTGLLFEHLDTSIGRIEDLETLTKINVVGVIPYFAEKGIDRKTAWWRSILSFGRKTKKEARFEKLQSQLITNQKESSIYMEAFRILGANIQVLLGGSGNIKEKVILITSSNPQEGKSIIAANLGIIMAQMGHKVILIDIDLRRSSVHKIFGLKKEKGLTDVLTEEIEFESAVRTTADLLLGDMSQDKLLKHPWIDNFHLITAGTTYPNSPYLLNTERMDDLIRILREKYDVILMDCSPVLAVSDTSIVAPKSDGVIFVYRAGTTSRMALRRAKMQIESTKGKGAVKGIILNNVTPEVSLDSYYYYYRGKYYKEK